MYDVLIWYLLLSQVMSHITLKVARFQRSFQLLKLKRLPMANSLSILSMKEVPQTLTKCEKWGSTWKVPTFHLKQRTNFNFHNCIKLESWPYQSSFFMMFIFQAWNTQHEIGWFCKIDSAIMGRIEITRDRFLIGKNFQVCFSAHFQSTFAEFSRTYIHHSTNKWQALG